MTAPTAKARKDDSAAVQPDGRSSGLTPNSSLACTRQACSGLADNWVATRAASSGSRPRARYMAASSASSAAGERCSSAFSTAISASVSSAWEVTETYSPVAMEKAPATRPANPVSTTVRCATPPPVTLAMSAKLDTRPSVMPNTAGRNQPPVTSRWVWWISMRSGSADTGPRLPRGSGGGAVPGRVGRVGRACRPGRVGRLDSVLAAPVPRGDKVCHGPEEDQQRDPVVQPDSENVVGWIHPQRLDPESVSYTHLTL